MSARNEITLEFSDGTEETVRLKPRFIVEAERKYTKGGGTMPYFEGMVYAGWLALDKPGTGFQSFLRKLDAVQLPDRDRDDDEEDGDENPTEAADS